MIGPCHILVVEDEWLLAAEAEETLTAAGYTVVGPVPTVEAALRLIEGTRIDAALLDVQLAHELSLSVADALVARQVPFVFLTGFTQLDLPSAYRHHPLIKKPARVEDLAVHFNGVARA